MFMTERLESERMARDSRVTRMLPKSLMQLERFVLNLRAIYSANDEMEVFLCGVIPPGLLNWALLRKVERKQLIKTIREKPSAADEDSFDDDD